MFSTSRRTDTKIKTQGHRRHEAPNPHLISCHQKHVVEFGEWLCEDVLKYVPHRQWVFSIPKRLRAFFMTRRRLFSRLSRCAWKVLSICLKPGAKYDGAVPGGVIAVQTFGDFQNLIHDFVIENMMNPADGGTDLTFIAARPSGQTMRTVWKTCPDNYPGIIFI